jgi:phospholipid/cholesterol/gamma-HCH transport system substrate-binding protein
MNDSANRTTLTAGLFVLIGLILLGTLIFEFGTLRHQLRKPYDLNAVFMDAENLIKGAPVKRAGATIGVVATSPELVDGLKGVKVRLEIYPEFQIPVGSPFKIASIGLMGDSLIEVGAPPPELLTGVYYKSGETITGAGGVDLTATASRITDEVLVVIRDLRNGLKDLNITVGKLNQGVLSEDNLNNFSGGLRELRQSIHKVDTDVMSDSNLNSIKEALTEFRAAMENVNASSKRIDGVMQKADSAMAKVDKAVDQLGPTLKGAEGAAITLKQAAVALEGLLKDARTGDGLMHAMLNDEALRNDVVALVANLRKSGLLFYKDKEGRNKPAPDQPPPPKAKPYGAR